jgi:hypothetical protein
MVALDDAVWDVEDIPPGCSFKPSERDFYPYIYHLIQPLDGVNYAVRLNMDNKTYFSTFAEAKAWLRSMMLVNL